MQKTKVPKCWKPQPILETDSIFQKRLKTLMNLNKESQNALARSIGIQPCNVNQWIRCGTIPETRSLLKLKEHYGCNIGYLFGETSHTGIKAWHNQE